MESVEPLGKLNGQLCPIVDSLVVRFVARDALIGDPKREIGQFGGGAITHIQPPPVDRRVLLKREVCGLGAIEELPAALAAQLSAEGRLVTGLVTRGVTRLAVGRKAAGEVALLPLAELGIPVLPEFAAPKRWSF